MAKFHKSPSNPEKTIRCRAKGECRYAQQGGIVVNAQNMKEAQSQIVKKENSRKRQGLKVPESVAQDKKSNSKIKRLYSKGMNVDFITSPENLFHKNLSTGRSKDVDSLVNSSSSDIDFFTDDFGKVDKEALLAVGNPLKM